jgi:hypothetical protein
MEATLLASSPKLVGITCQPALPEETHGSSPGVFNLQMKDS